MTTRKKRILLTVVSLYIGWGLTSGAIQLIADRNAKKECEDWRIRAIQSASPATSFDSAGTWLKANGFRVVMSKAQQQTNDEPPHEIVWGQRLLRKKSRVWATDPTWLNVIFRFSEAGAFQDVQCKLVDLESEFPKRDPSLPPPAYYPTAPQTQSAQGAHEKGRLQSPRPQAP